MFNFHSNSNTMSVHTIYYKDGAKMMRPVLTREEYLALRGSQQQQRTLQAVRQGDERQKSRLLQMNYSCLPGEDGRLKGATTMSTTVGMDIDWTPAPLPDEGEEQIAARKEQWLRKVPELVLKKKEELGLLMLERSATKGYHLVFRRHPEPKAECRISRRPVPLPFLWVSPSRTCPREPSSLCLCVRQAIPSGSHSSSVL